MYKTANIKCDKNDSFKTANIKWDSNLGKAFITLLEDFAA